MANEKVAAMVAPETKVEEEKEFNRLIVRDQNGTRYTLEFNRRTVETMERRGFKLDMDYPNTNIKELFRGAFQVNHKGMMPDRIDRIWDQQKNKEGLLGKLVQLYMKPLEALMAEPKDEDENPTWETV